MKKTIILSFLLAMLLDLTSAIRCYECAGLKCGDPFKSDDGYPYRCDYAEPVCYVSSDIKLLNSH